MLELLAGLMSKAIGPATVDLNLLSVPVLFLFAVWLAIKDRDNIP